MTEKFARSIQAFYLANERTINDLCETKLELLSEEFSY